MTAQTAPVTRPITGPPSSRPPRRRRRKPNAFRTLSTVLIVLIVIVQVYPLAWLFLTSLRNEHDFATGNPFALPTLVHASTTTPGRSRPAISARTS